MADVTIAHDEELERAWDIWVLVRKSLGVVSFGLNIVELPPGSAIPEHDEVDRDQEEVFAVLDGAATLVVDGVEHPLRRGSFARIGTAPRRYVRNDGDALARVLIVSAPVTSGYEPMSWA
ncbi:MAG: cupin domain-containing protein [Gaiella sp.]